MNILGSLFILNLKKYKGIHVSIIAKVILKLAKSESIGLTILESDKFQEIGR